MKRTFLFFMIILFCLTSGYSHRIISMRPSYTEIIFKLKMGDKLVGVTNYCNWPPEAKKITRIGDYLNPDIEKIYELKPTIIFSGRGLSKKLTYDFKGKVKIVEISDEKKVSDIYTTLKIIGKMIGREKLAHKIIDKMRKKIRKIEMKNYSIKKTTSTLSITPTDVNAEKIKVYVELDKDNWTFGKDSFLNDVLDISGGKNIFSDVMSSYFRANWEEIVKKNPDVVLLFNTTEKEFLSRPLVDKINAVKNGRVYVISGELRDKIMRPSPRIVEGIEFLYKLLHESE